MQTRALILANTELDSCLAANLLVENIYDISAIKYRPAEGYETYSDDDEDLCEDEDLIHVLEDSLAINIAPNIDICFCDSELVIINALKIAPEYSFVALVGYEEIILEKMHESVLSPEQELLCLPQIYTTIRLSMIIDWGKREDPLSATMIAASLIWESEFLGIKLDTPVEVKKKYRKRAERIIDFYQESYRIARGLYENEPAKMNTFFMEFLNNQLYNVRSYFLEEMMEEEPILRRNTLDFQNSVKHQGNSIGLINIGNAKVLKLDMLLAMKQMYCHGIIQFIDADLQKKVMTCDYDYNILIQEGEFKKNHLIDKN